VVLKTVGGGPSPVWAETDVEVFSSAAQSIARRRGGAHPDGAHDHSEHTDGLAEARFIAKLRDE